jgi:hypothetical protein
VQRDRDYLRLILETLHESDQSSMALLAPLSETDTSDQLNHHFDLLIDEGLVNKSGKYSYRLTTTGHDAMEIVGDKSFWEKLKSVAPKEAYQLMKGVGSTLAVNSLSSLMGWN